MHLQKSSFKILPKATYSHVYRFQSWYSPIFIKSTSNDETNGSTCITFDVQKDREQKHFLTLANILPPSPLDSHEVLTHAVNLNNDFTNNTMAKLPSLYTQNCIVLPANDNLTNHFAYQLQFDALPIRRLWIETNGMNLEGLLHHAMKVLKQNRFYLLPHKEKPHTLRSLDADFLNIVSAYPDIEAYALTYAWAQALVYADRFMHIFREGKAKDKKPFDHGYGVEKAWS